MVSVVLEKLIPQLQAGQRSPSWFKPWGWSFLYRTLINRRSVGGWAVGMQLAALALNELSGEQERRAFIEAFIGDDFAVQAVLHRMSKLGPQHTACAEAIEVWLQTQSSVDDLHWRRYLGKLPREKSMLNTPTTMGVQAGYTRQQEGHRRNS